MPIWFWLNIPACIPLWLVLTRPAEEPTPTPGRIGDAELVSSST